MSRECNHTQPSPILIVIPSRGGSKGLPRKNIKNLAGKPLICYSIDTAKQLVSDKFICVSTDDDETIKIVEEYGLQVPFKRPAELATDTASSYSVLEHTVKFYEEQGHKFYCIILMQPTSPFRSAKHLKEALKLYSPSLDMVVSVKKAKTNPYYSLLEEDEEGFLKASRPRDYHRRQDCPPVFELNGAIYIINPLSLKKYTSLNQFPRVKKYEMDEISSLDIDTPLDWELCELTIAKNLYKL